MAPQSLLQRLRTKSRRALRVQTNTNGELGGSWANHSAPAWGCGFLSSRMRQVAGFLRGMAKGRPARATRDAGGLSSVGVRAGVGLGFYRPCRCLGSVAALACPALSGRRARPVLERSPRDAQGLGAPGPGVLSFLEDAAPGRPGRPLWPCTSIFHKSHSGVFRSGLAAHLLPLPTCMVVPA